MDRDFRPPPYAQRLIARRRARQLVLRVHLVVGNDWTPPPLGPLDAFLALAPARWTPGAVDWRCLTDLLVVVHDRTDGWPQLWDVIGEVSDLAAVVWRWTWASQAHRGRNESLCSSPLLQA